MSTTVMQENSRSPGEASNGGGDPEQGREQGGEPGRPSGAPKTPSPPSRPFVGHAMRALFESSDVSIRRGDETRVMSRAQEALAEIQRKTSAPPPAPKSPPPAAAPRSDPPPPISSRPPAPRVDAVLWIVLAVGIFAIAGWMLAYAL